MPFSSNESIKPPFSIGSAASIFLAVIVLLLIGGATHYYMEFTSRLEQSKSEELLNVTLTQKILVADMGKVTSDLLLLSSYLSELDYQPQDYTAITQMFTLFAHQKTNYSQVRFLDANGQELVRVNNENGVVGVVKQQQLQNKLSRYYVQYGIRLDKGQVYMSPLDLNVEAGEVEAPYRPMQRFVAPVFDRTDKRQGMVVLNYRGDDIIQRFKDSVANIAGHVQLLNSDGYWLISPRKGESWGFMLGKDDLTFARRYPKIWSQIAVMPSGQLLLPEGLFTFAVVYPGYVDNHENQGVVADNNIEHWYIVSHLPSHLAMPSITQFLSRYWRLYLLLLVLLALLSFLLGKSMQHHKMVETWKERESFFRKILSDIELAAVMIDTSGKVTFCNRFLDEIRSSLLHQDQHCDWLDVMVPDDVRGQMMRVLQGTTGLENKRLPRKFYRNVKMKDGSEKHFAWHITCVRDSNNRIWGLTAIGEDITDKWLAEEETRKLHRAVEQSPSIVAITDKNGDIVYVNPKFTEVTGYQPEEVHGKNPRILQSGETKTEQYAEMWRKISAGKEWRGEFHNKRKNGDLYWAAATVSGLTDADGKITHFLAVQEDITDRKRMEGEIASTNRELARAHTLTEMGRMASMIAHDLRNPLSSVKMSLQMLNKLLPERNREPTTIGLEQVRYMEGIITDMLAYTRPDDLKMEWLDIEKLLESVMRSLRRQVEDYEVDVDMHISPGLPTFPGDTNKLRQLFSNLLVNAMQATEASPIDDKVVEVYAMLDFSSSGTRIRVEICDRGSGISEQIKDDLFDAFFTTKAKGTGLGLAIVQRIAEQHGAEVLLEPGQVKGTCAVVVLQTVPVDAL